MMRLRGQDPAAVQTAAAVVRHMCWAAQKAPGITHVTAGSARTNFSRYLRPTCNRSRRPTRQRPVAAEAPQKTAA